MLATTFAIAGALALCAPGTPEREDLRDLLDDVGGADRQAIEFALADANRGPEDLAALALDVAPAPTRRHAITLIAKAGGSFTGGLARERTTLALWFGLVIRPELFLALAPEAPSPPRPERIRSRRCAALVRPSEGGALAAALHEARWSALGCGRLGGAP